MVKIGIVRSLLVNLALPTSTYQYITDFFGTLDSSSQPELKDAVAARLPLSNAAIAGKAFPRDLRPCFLHPSLGCGGLPACPPCPVRPGGLLLLCWTHHAHAHMCALRFARSGDSDLRSFAEEEVGLPPAAAASMSH